MNKQETRKENKRNSKVAVLVIVLTLITCFFVGNTYAKYVSNAAGSDTADIAKWSWEIGGTAADLSADAPSFTFNLFDTIIDTKDGAGTLEAGAEGSHVSASHIAPGTKGSVELTIKNASEVTAKYEIAVSDDLTSSPIVYTIKKGETEVTGEQTIEIGATDTLTISWVWAFSSSDTQDEADTLLGIAGGQVKTTATLTLTQVD